MADTQEWLPPQCEGCGHKMPRLEALLFAQGVRQLPVPSMGGIRNLLLCGPDAPCHCDCRGVVVNFIRAVLAKRKAAELAEQTAVAPPPPAG